jgi:hypothetical protein
MSVSDDYNKFALLATLFCVGVFYSNLVAAAELPPYRTTADANIGSSLAKTRNISAPSNINQIIVTNNPFAGNLGQPTGFSNIAVGETKPAGGSQNTLLPFVNNSLPFAFASSVSVSPLVSSAATIQYSFQILSHTQSSIPVNLRSTISQSIGYQAVGLNADPTIIYGYFGQDTQSDIVISIQPFGFGDITNFVKICGMSILDCSAANGNITTWNNQYIFQTNSLYYITLSAGTRAFSPPPIGFIFTSSFATSYINSYLEIDSSIFDQQQYSLQFSAGVRNALPLLSVPEPSMWVMLLLGFGVIGLSIRRKKAEKVIVFE